MIEFYGGILTLLQHLMPAGSHIKKINPTTEQKLKKKQPKINAKDLVASTEGLVSRVSMK